MRYLGLTLCLAILFAACGGKLLPVVGAYDAQPDDAALTGDGGSPIPQLPPTGTQEPPALPPGNEPGYLPGEHGPVPTTNELPPPG